MKSESLPQENRRPSEPVAEHILPVDRAFRLLEQFLVYPVCDGCYVVAGTTMVGHIDPPVMEDLHE